MEAREMRRLILYAVNGFMQNSSYNFLISFLNRRGVAVKDVIAFLSEYGEMRHDDTQYMVEAVIKDLIAERYLKQMDLNAVITSYPPISVPENELFTRIANRRIEEIKNYRPRVRRRRGTIIAKKD